jgi:hypothetical protein
VQLPNSQSVMAVAFDQVSKDKSVRALLNNFERQEPIVLLMDDKYRLFPYDMGKMTYSVLGYYWIVDAWGMVFVFRCSRNRTLTVLLASGAGTVKQLTRILRQVQVCIPMVRRARRAVVGT